MGEEMPNFQPWSELRPAAIAAWAGPPMQNALQACRELFARVEDGAGLVPLDRTGAVVLALEREFETAELQSIVLQLSTRDDGRLDFLGLCEVVTPPLFTTPQRV